MCLDVNHFTYLQKLYVDWLEEQSSHAVGSNLFVSFMYFCEESCIGIDMCDIDFTEPNI